MRPDLRLTSMTIGTSRPLGLARFYAGLLGWRVTEAEEPVPGDPVRGGWAQVKPPEGVAGFTLNFEYELHYRPPVWPSVPGAQNATQHLDIHVPDLAAGVEWAVACGAVLAEFQPQQDVRVMIDPDGHPFCLFL
ncbi:VOC family protein [Nonomuraea insulae]|uniref:VOC family protein n=1 Tax=Nonomuraea insulae TaxID=1616787 RepID=A0ABW1D8S2_9ACTN